MGNIRKRVMDAFPLHIAKILSGGKIKRQLRLI